MGVRKNAKHLTAAEREAFVRACVSMKADIVNPGASAADQYSRWDEMVAIHRMIQNVNAPGAPNPVNFGHGGGGAYSFLSWHRYFLHLMEQRLQGYVSGVMLPYWDWTDPAPIMTDTFLGPDGDAATTVVTRGYFAATAPGTPGNPTPAPSWWPPSLTGWQLHTAFGSFAGALERNVRPVAELPSVDDLREALSMTDYAAFQAAVEGGTGLTSFHGMHNSLHGWVGGHMGSLTGSPFDPLFYLHHCNIDRLWAMWQADGHATTYPSAGANPHHGPNDLMFPWTGGASGYSSNHSFAPIVMPDFSAAGPQHNVDTLPHRTAFGYTYDTLAVIGIGLDRTGSMTALTPDPMTVAAPDVTKWEAATRGVSAFLQDCETVQASAATYVVAGVKTFRSTPANQFDPVFPGTPYGLIKAGTSYSRATFDGAVAGMAPGGGTPLADALRDVEDTLVEPPFGGVPGDEQRYLAMLTDGLLTSGSPMTSIADGEFGGTAIFALGFGTGADVDYATLDGMVAKGRTVATQQVFHGDNAGTIDKFYSNSLAAAIGFTTLFDPVLELFAGEHVHLDIDVTSADDAIFVTAQGMDFVDENWSFHLIGPDGVVAYADGGVQHGHGHAHGAHGGRRPDVTARRATGRLSLMLQRDSADASAWVGRWQLMAAYRATVLDGMVMPDIGELIWPVSAGPIRGSRFGRLLQSPKERVAARSVASKARHRLDVRPPGTNRDESEASTLVVNMYARTRLRVTLAPREGPRLAGDELALEVREDVLLGSARSVKSFARLAAPAQDLRELVRGLKKADIPEAARLKGSKALKVDPARALATLERKRKSLARIRDEELEVVSHHGGAAHMHIHDTEVGGVYHVGMYVAGTYTPDAAGGGHDHDGGGHDHGAGHEHAPATAGAEECCEERYSRILSATVAMESRS